MKLADNEFKKVHEGKKIFSCNRNYGDKEWKKQSDFEPKKVEMKN